MADFNYHGPVVAFDLDDTLFRERDFCRSGFHFLCDSARYSDLTGDLLPITEDLEKLYEEMEKCLMERKNPFEPFETYFRPLYIASGKEWNLQTHIADYRNHIPKNLQLAEGVGELLEALSQKGVKLALITDGRSGTQRRKIEALHLDSFFAPDLIFISEETGVDKHSPEAFAQVVRKFPEASGFYYIGDNIAKDFYNPNLLGWNTIKVPFNSDNVHPEIEPPTPLHSPKLRVTDLTDIINLIT